MDRWIFPLILWTFIVLAMPSHAASESFKPRGIGGGGGLFCPAISEFDPKLMFVASDMSGIYRSDNGGKKWALVPSSQIADTARAKAPVFFPKKIFWNSRLHIFMSKNSGKTWEKVTRPWKKYRHIRFLFADKTGPNFLFAAAKDNLWRMDLHSQSWKRSLAGESIALATLGKTILTINNNRLMASRDHGNTWTEYDVPFGKENKLLELAAATSRSGSLLLLTVQDKGVFRSIDEGKTWRKSLDFDHQAILQIPAKQTHIAWAVQQKNKTGKKVWKSDDGGKSWKEVFHYSGTKKNVVHSWINRDLHWGYFITRNGFYASTKSPQTALVATQGDLFITHDGGISWQSLINKKTKKPSFYKTTGLEVTTSYQYLFDPWESHRHYAAFADFGCIRSVDNGHSWSHAMQGSPWRNTLYRIRFDPEIHGKLYAAASNRHDLPNWSQIGQPKKKKYNVGGVIVSTDFGKTWQSVAKNFPSAPCTDIFILKHHNKTHLYATAFGKGIFTSSDGGKIWKNITGNMRQKNLNTYRLWVHPHSHNIYCLITALKGPKNAISTGGLWRSSNHGKTWTELTMTSPIRWPTDFQVDPFNEKTLFISVASIPKARPQQGGIWKSDDGGKTWNHVLQDRYFKPRPYDRFMTVKIHPQNHHIIYAGGFLNGLWISYDSGLHWKRYTDVPFRSVQSITFNPRNSQEMVITTFGSGIWSGPALPEKHTK